MQRYFAKISFNGTLYKGWQTQPDARSVQQEIEYCFGTYLNESIAITGAGRTDTGVHARDYFFHFDSANEELDNGEFAFRINSFLPPDIVVHKLYKVTTEAHARFDAITRTYEYTITRQKDPFRQDSAFYVYGDIDMESMNKACLQLLCYDDFKAFCKTGSDVKHHLCTVYQAEWTENNNLLVFRIKANRFLRNMVRAITGTCILIGLGKYDVGDMKRIIESKNRKEAGFSAPAKGLALVNVEYPPHLFL